MIKLYNTLTRKKEAFKPIVKGKVGIYTCGPTVYWYQHIGNLRSYIFSDILRRVLEFNNLKVKHIINVTDVGHLTSDSDEGDDKMELAVLKEGRTAKEIANFYFNEFVEDFERLNILKPLKWAWASKHIGEQIELIKILEKKGFTYKTSDGIYFDSSKFKNYGKLAKLNVKGLKEGKRVSVGEKKNKTDFALWKFSLNLGERQQEWKSPWGIGFPGWHLECSAMSMKYLGNIIDIHTGGEDHIPVHHTNEIAQSECVTGKKFVNFWIHGAFLLNGDGKKVSKSTGGLYRVSELEEKGYSAPTFRYLCLQTHYRKPLKFSLDSLDASKNAYDKIKRRIIELRKEKHKGIDRTKSYLNDFLKAINDDLNTSRALEVFWKVLDDRDFDVEKKLKLLEKFDEIFGLGIKNMKKEDLKIPEDILKLVNERDKARNEMDWVRADILRKKINEKGFIVEDVSGKSVLRKKTDIA
ncbi:MAG: cysteine--tRNA ligase [Candidatus Pacearchaeota archaeon]|nr:cysteine--tRNA ligase [Candidatus Pacearchaeota archaeon]